MDIKPLDQGQKGLLRMFLVFVVLANLMVFCTVRQSYLMKNPPAAHNQTVEPAKNPGKT